MSEANGKAAKMLRDRLAFQDFEGKEPLRLCTLRARLRKGCSTH